MVAEVRLRHASHHVPFETEPNRDLKKGESACEDPWYEQPRITKLPTIHSDRADSGKVPGNSYACPLSYLHGITYLRLPLRGGTLRRGSPY